MQALNRFLALLVTSVLFGACASETTTTEHQVKKDVWGNDEPFSIGKDADGNPVMKSDKRSSFENKNSNLAGHRDFSGKDYTSNSYRKKRWGGDTKYDRKQYAGKTSADQYKQEPWFVQKQASAVSKQASSSNKKFLVNPFRSKSSSVKNSKHISSAQDARVSNRRQSYQQPNITHWKEQDGLSVKDTNGMLGR